MRQPYSSVTEYQEVNGYVTVELFRTKIDAQGIFNIDNNTINPPGS